MLSLVQIVAVFLSLGDFGAAANPKAPSAAEILKFAPEQYDLMVWADLEVVMPKNYKALLSLADDPIVKSNPELAGQVQQMVREAEAARQMARSSAGFDPIEDVKSIAMFTKFKGRGEQPDMLVVVRGKLPVDKLKGLVGMAMPGFSAGAGPGGEFLFGTKAWVDEREAKGWKAKKANPQVAAMLKTKPLFAVTSTLSPEAAAMLSTEIGTKENVLRDMLEGHSFAGLYVGHNGAGWTYAARSKQGYARAAMASDGMIELMRSGHLAMRGFARVFLAAVDSYGEIPALKPFIARKSEILALVLASSGDGKFKAAVSKQPAKQTVAVALSGKTLSQVVPLGGIFAIGGIGALFMLRSGPDHSVATAPSPVEAVPPKPVETGGRMRVRETYKASRAKAGL